MATVETTPAAAPDMHDHMPLNGIDHVELWTGNAAQAAHYLTHAFGFTETAYRGLETGTRDHVSHVLEQGRVRLVLTGSLTGEDRIADHHKHHGDGVWSIALSVPDATAAYDHAVAHGGTPMCAALKSAETILTDWVAQHADAFPPIVINITDGESTDGDPTAAALAIQNLATSDGNVLLFNVHLSSHRASPIEFPDGEDGLPDQYAKLLFGLSSLLPSYMQSVASDEGYRASDGSRSPPSPGGSWPPRTCRTAW